MGRAGSFEPCLPPGQARPLQYFFFFLRFYYYLFIFKIFSFIF